MCLMCSSCSYSPAVTILCLPCPHPRAASTNPAGSRLCADGMGTFCWGFDPSVVPKGCTQGQRAEPPGSGEEIYLLLVLILPSISFEESQHFQGEVPLCSIREQGAFIIQLGFSTAALIPLPHSHADWHFPASLEDSVAVCFLHRDVMQSFSSALEQEFSFPFRVFIPSFLEQTQLSGGQQGFLLQVPINQDYNYFLKAFFFFFPVFP